MPIDELTGLHYPDHRITKSEEEKILKNCRTYISGKITGIEEKAQAQFEEAEQSILAAGLTPANPFKFNHDHDKSWESYMRVCIIELCKCDAIYMLPNWKISRGAQIEHKLALQLGLPIIKDLREIKAA